MPETVKAARATSSRSLHIVLCVLLAFVSLTALLSLRLLPASHPNVSIGEVSPQDVEAPRYLEMVNEEATKEARERAAKDVPTVFVYNPRVRAEVVSKVEATFAILQQMYNTPERENELIKELPIPISAQNLATLRSIEGLDLAQLQSIVRAAVDRVMQEKIPDFRLEDARKGVVQSIKSARVPPALLPAVTEIAQRAIKANFVNDYEATVKARQQKMQQVEPVKTVVTRGQMIVRKGDLVTPEQMAVLDALGIHRRSLNLYMLLGNALFVCLAIFVVGIYLSQQESPLLSEPRLLWLLCLLVIAVLAMARAGTQLSIYFAPVATASLLIAVLLDYRLALLVTTLMALCVGMMTGEFAPCAVAMMTGMVAVLSVTNVTRRGDLILATLVVWLVNVLAVLVFSLWNAEDLSTLTRNTLLWGTLSGLTASVVAVGALPFLEAIFNVTTHIKLLELSNPSEPLLQRLMVDAPGTYHHSMIVANLAESATRAIEGDGLLAKVGAYYHDIGKMKAANFFVENQLGQENPHDRLTPTLSAHIIISHVHDGMEMARQARIPQMIADFIDMHHGDRLVSYFYRKALQRGESVSESEFRYHGRRPRTKETAIVMMADTIEAKARLVAKPDQESLDKMVRESIKTIMDDGQLDDSDLSLRDIQVITRTFVKTLMSIYHTRIEYPKEPEAPPARAQEKPSGGAPAASGVFEKTP